MAVKFLKLNCCRCRHEQRVLMSEPQVEPYILLSRGTYLSRDRCKTLLSSRYTSKSYLEPLEGGIR